MFTQTPVSIHVASNTEALRSFTSTSSVYIFHVLYTVQVKSSLNLLNSFTEHTIQLKQINYL